MTTKSSAKKARAHRERAHKPGMRLVEIWVPDVNSPEFAAEAHRQSRLISESPSAEEDQSWVDSVSADIWD